MQDRTIPNRADVPSEKRWDTSSVYASNDEWEQAFSRVSGSLETLEAFRGKLAEGPTVLADWFETFESIWQELEKIHLYASLFHHADTTDQEAAAKNGRAIGLYAQVAAVASFADPELLAIEAERLRSWVEQEPRLAHYGHAFDQLERRRPHVRSAEVEELLGQLGDPFYTADMTHGILADADLVFEPVRARSGGAEELLPVAQGTIDALLTHEDREVRREAWQSYADAHLAHRNTMANCLANCAKQHAFLARTRGFDSCLEAALSTDNIPTEVFHAFIDTFRRHLPTWHRYWRIRRKALGVDKLAVYDLKAPLSKASPSFGYSQAVDWICEGMQPLGEDYVKVLRQGATGLRWVDALPNRGKRAGAFSTGCMGTHPFILMSFTDDVFSLSTLAHELGHSMHSYLTWENQPMVYSEYSIFAAEVASNFNQAMVRRSLLERKPERDFQIALLEEALANFHRYFFIMPTLACFELELHQRAERGDPLTADFMIGFMRDLFKEGYGDEVEMDDGRVGITWAQFPTHLYANFYVYQYGTGISAAQALTEAVEHEGQPAVERYLRFLKAGGSRYPIDILREAGVDLTSNEPVERAFGALSELIDRLEGLLFASES